MILVYVWSMKRHEHGKNVGHASMLVKGNTYVSWWPDQAAGPGQDFNPIRNKSYASDCDDEGGPPDHKVDLNGLDEAKILDWWAGLGLVRDGKELAGPMLPYNLLKQNCSTVVARGLKAGGGDTYATWYSSWSVVWRPATVLDYAHAIQRGLANRPG